MRSETHIVRVKFVEKQKWVQVRNVLVTDRSLELYTHAISGRSRFDELGDLSEAVAGQGGALNLSDRGCEDRRSHKAGQEEDEDELSYCERHARGTKDLE
jgi:hypothetical protein